MLKGRHPLPMPDDAPEIQITVPPDLQVGVYANFATVSAQTEYDFNLDFIQLVPSNPNEPPRRSRRGAHKGRAELPHAPYAGSCLPPDHDRSQDPRAARQAGRRGSAMSPNVLDIPPTQVGGPSQFGTPESAGVQVGEPRRVHYRGEPGGHAYRVAMAPFRLTAVLERTEEGFVASSPELETLGYGADPTSAVSDLVEATRDYLSLLAESDTPLSPRIAHHAWYLPLLRVPPNTWFAAFIGTFFPNGPDAAWGGMSIERSSAETASRWSGLPSMRPGSYWITKGAATELPELHTVTTRYPTADFSRAS